MVTTKIFIIKGSIRRPWPARAVDNNINRLFCAPGVRDLEKKVSSILFPQFERKKGVISSEKNITATFLQGRAVTARDR